MTQLHWTFHDDSSPFPELEPEQPEQRNPSRWMVTLVCLTILVGAAIGYDSQAEKRTVRQQIQATVADGQVVDVSLRGNMAVARVIQASTDPGWQAQHTTRFLVQSDDGWYTLDPHPSFWGEQREQTTAHFHFLYRALDAESVEPLAAEVDTLYSALLRDLGLSDRPKERFVVEIVPEEEPTVYPTHHLRLRVASPHLRALSTEQSGRDFLARRLGDWLSSRLLASYTTRPLMVAPNARFMLECLRRSTVDRWAPPERYWLLARRQYLQRALAEDRWLDLEHFDALLFGQRDREARLFHCSAVAEFIAHQYGPGGMAGLLNAMQHEPSWTRALESSLGLSYERFLAQWLSWLDTHIRLDARQRPVGQLPRRR